MVDGAIRPAEPRDVPAIKRVAEHAWNEVYDDVLQQDTIDAALAEWYANELLLEHVQDSDVSFFVTEAERTLTGYVSGGQNEFGHGEVGAIYVDPDHWRTGTGSRLLEYFEDHGRAEGWNTMQIRVVAGNDVARPFYEKHGYEVEETKDVPLFGEPIEEVCYQKRLD